MFGFHLPPKSTDLPGQLPLFDEEFSDAPSGSFGGVGNPSMEYSPPADFINLLSQRIVAAVTGCDASVGEQRVEIVARILREEFR